MADESSGSVSMVSEDDITYHHCVTRGKGTNHLVAL